MIATQQIQSYRGPAPTQIVARKRLVRTRTDWLQWLLYCELSGMASLPDWACVMFQSFAVNYSPFANHSRARIESYGAQGVIGELLWRRERPGLLGYVDPTLLTNAADESGIILEAAWENDQCGPLTANYINSHTQPPELTGDLPGDLRRWW